LKSLGQFPRPWPGSRFLPEGFRAVAGASTWLILAAGLGQGAMLLASLIVANLVGVADYGRYALLQSTILMLAGIAQLSFAVVIAQQVSSLRERQPELAGQVAAFCLLVTAVLSLCFAAFLFFGRHFLAEALFRDAGLGRGIALAAIALPWAALAAVQQGLLNGLERFRDQAAISLLSLPLVIALPAYGAFSGGYEGALAGLAGAYALRSAVSHWRIAAVLRSAGIRWSLGDLRGKARLLRNYALPATLSGTATLLAIWGSQTILVRSPGGSITLGMFAAAFTVKTMVMFVPTQMLGALMPALSRGHARGESAGRRRLLYFTAAAALAVTIVLAGAGMVLAPWLMGLFGSGFTGGEDALRLLLLATPLEALTATLYQDVQSRGRFWRNLFFVNLPLAVTTLAAAALLVPGGLAAGLALAWLIGWAVALAGTLLAMTTGTDE
jgi:O-antigen/teichoic acid export membrane protein